jgi:hypothetical protein
MMGACCCIVLPSVKIMSTISPPSVSPVGTTCPPGQHPFHHRPHSSVSGKGQRLVQLVLTKNDPFSFGTYLPLCLGNQTCSAHELQTVTHKQRIFSSRKYARSTLRRPAQYLKFDRFTGIPTFRTPRTAELAAEQKLWNFDLSDNAGEYR